MTLKRTYQVPSRYTRESKRARTLESQVSTLKKQVSANKKELKYFDGFRTLGPSETSLNISLLLWSQTGTTNPVFVGRKIHIKKIEIRVNAADQQNVRFYMWRERRQGKNASGQHPTNLDPEYHTYLRHWEQNMDTDTLVKNFTVDFGQQGRLVEFDEQTTATATGDIVSGDIKVQYIRSNSSELANIIDFRVWYTDG